VHQSPLHRPRRLARRDSRRGAATAVTASVAAVLLAGGITAATLSIASAAQATAGKAALSVNWYESARTTAR
jgi:chloramphenicol 3-O-phosphotransferase